MRNLIFVLLLAVPLAGCLQKGAVIPPTDGIYGGSLATSAGGSDTVIALIDSNGKGMIIDQTNPAIYSFTVGKPDDNGNLPTTSLVYCPGAGLGVSGTSCSIAGTFGGTVNGNNSGKRDSIAGNLNIGGGNLAYTLFYNDTLYQTNVTSLTSIVTPVGTTTPSLRFSYTPSGASSPTTVTFTLSDTLNTATSGYTYYPFTTTADSRGCTYNGQISMPNGGANAFELSLSPIASTGCTATATLSGLAYVNGTSPTTLTLQFNDGSGFALAASATLNN